MKKKGSKERREGEEGELQLKRRTCNVFEPTIEVQKSLKFQIRSFFLQISKLYVDDNVSSCTTDVAQLCEVLRSLYQSIHETLQLSSETTFKLNTPHFPKMESSAE